MKKLWNNLKLMLSSSTRHYEIGGYLANGSAIVYEGSRPDIYTQEGGE